MKKYVVEFNIEVLVTVNDEEALFNFEGAPRGDREVTIADVAQMVGIDNRPLSMVDGYADLNDDVADAYVVEFNVDRVEEID